MAIDLAVSRAVTKIRALERAVHDGGPWTMELDDLVVPAQRTLGGDGVRFSAYFPHNRRDMPVILRSGADQIWVDGPIPISDHGFEVALELCLPAGVAA